MDEIIEGFKRVAERPDTAPDKHGSTLQKTRDAREMLLQQTVENIRRSEHLRVEITKGIQAGEEPVELLKKAVLCISLMTGDQAFYDSNVK